MGIRLIVALLGMLKDSAVGSIVNALKSAVGMPKSQMERNKEKLCKQCESSLLEGVDAFGD